MIRMFEVREITKLLDVLIGKTEAVGETNEDERRLDNLKTLIDVTNWCLDGLQFAMASGYGRAEYSMAEISYTAQCALDEYGRWIADVLDEQIADHKTENSSEKPNNCEHITEDGVTCAKYPACDDCLDNPLNKVKGSERLVKGSDESQPEPSGYKTKPVEDEPQLHMDGYYRKDEPTISKMEQVDKDINVRSKTEPQKDCKKCKNYDRCKNNRWKCCVYQPKDEPQICEDCKHNGEKHAYDYACDKCTDMDKFQHEDEPQTETGVIKTIIHKMIDNTNIAEDAYPDLRQRLHDAVDEYEPQTDCAWK